MELTLSEPEGYSRLISRTADTATAEGNHLKLEKAIAGWSKDPTPGRLGDVLAFSIAPGVSDRLAIFAAEVLARRRDSTPAQHILMKVISQEQIPDPEQETEATKFSICNPHTRDKVSEARRLFRINPANPLVLLDLAQAKVASGNAIVGEKLLRGALSLSPNSRIILRTLARFMVHTDRVDEAHALIARHRRTATDTWLMASEIALSQAAKVSSRFAAKGVRICKERAHSYTNLSELAGALGGLALAHGQSKRGRDLYRLALHSPNDNVLAQAVCDRSELSFDISAVSPKSSHDAAEARAMLAIQGLDLKSSQVHGIKWHEEEPFSSRPLLFLTTVMAAQGLYIEASALARRGLVAEPKSAPLLGALAYSLAFIEGELPLAERLAKRAMALDPSLMGGPATATMGLIAMQRGNWELGDTLYNEAVQIFESKDQRKLAALCLAYYSRSAEVTHHPNRVEILTRSMEAFERDPSVDSAVILQSLGGLNLELDAFNRASNRRVSQAIYDPIKNELIVRQRVTAKGAPLLTFQKE